MIKKNISIDNINFYIYDLDHSFTAQYCEDHFNANYYKLRDLELKPSEVFLDVGANIGAISFYIAKKFPESKVIAVEPFKETFDLMKKACEEQNIKNIELVNTAIAGSERPLTIVCGRGLSGCAKEGILEKLHPDDKFYISEHTATTLPNLMSNLNVSYIDVAKFNIEGAEFEVFDSISDEWLSKNIGNILIELHYSGGVEKYESLENRIKNLYPNCSTHLA